VLQASLNTTHRPKTATDSSGSKVGNALSKTQHLVDREHYFFHVKFESAFVVSFTRKYTSNKKRHFSLGMVHPFFQKIGGWKNRQLFGSLNWRIPVIDGTCVDRVPRANYSSGKVKFFRSYTWHRVKSIVYTKKKFNQSCSSGISIPSLKFSPKNWEGN
jgi:hypothetical protein